MTSVLAFAFALVSLQGDAQLQLQGAAQSSDFLLAEYVTDIAVSEEHAGRVADDLRAGLLAGLRTQDWARVEGSFSTDARALIPRSSGMRSLVNAGVEIVDWPTAELDALDRVQALALLREHTERWIAVDRASCKLYRFLLSPELDSAYGAAHVVLAGRLPGGERTELRAEVELALSKSADEPWRIRELRFLDGHRVAGGELFRDISDVTGFHFNESQSQRAYNRSIIDDRQLLTVGGVNAFDWNGDGFPDLLATWRDQMSVLFVNDGQGGFTRAELPFDGPEDAGQAFLFLDLDGDGREELVGSQIAGYAGDRAWIDLFTRSDSDGTWRRIERALEFDFPAEAWGINVQSIEPGDVDGDGLLDLFFSVHSDSRSGGESFNRFVSFDGGDNLLFINRGGLSFDEESDARGVRGTQYTFLARLFDFDEDGDLDLFEGNDYGPNWLSRNDGGGRFERDESHALSSDASYTMGFTLADFDNTGDWNLHLSNMYSHAGNRIVPLAANLSAEMRARVAVIGKGNQIFTRDAGTGEWGERGQRLRIHDSGWAWGSTFFDLENDGDKDLFVTNGYSSNSDAEAPDW